MLTPNEIAERKFDKVMVWGYDMNAVDSFLESVSTDYAQLYKENIALKNKMKVLVSKIEEYRSVDESMRQALLNAKNLAAEMSTNAEAEATKVRTAAESEAAKCRADAQAEADTLLSTAQTESDRLLSTARTESEKLLSDAQAEATRVREEALAIAAKYRTEAEAEAEASLASYKERIAAQETHLEAAKANVQTFVDRAIELYRKELDTLTAVREQELSYEVLLPTKPAAEIPTAVSAPVIETLAAPAPIAAPVVETPVVVAEPVVKEAPAAPVIPETPAVKEAPQEELFLPDTVTLPDLPPIPTPKPAAASTAPQPKPAKRVYEVDTDDEDEDEFIKPAKRRIDEVVAAKRAAAQRNVREEDNEETIVLTPKPRFEFSNLQFGDKYNSSDKKRK